MPQAGQSNIWMALDGREFYLCIDTNGYGIALQPYRLETIFCTNLPGSGQSVTDVVAGGEGGAFYTNEGNVFQLDVGGGVDGHIKLSGMSLNETRLAIIPTALGPPLIVRVDRYAWGLTTTPQRS